MKDELENRYFIALRGFYGTNSITYKNIELEVTKYNYNYSNSVTNFDWGNTQKGSQLLAYAMLETIATPTVARIYANKFMHSVIANLKEDEWKMEATEVAHWINKNTDYTIKLSTTQQEESIKSEKNFSKEIEKRTVDRVKSAKAIINDFCIELHIQIETLAKILDVPVETIYAWQENNEIPKLALKSMEFYKAGRMIKEQNTRFKTDIKELQEKLLQNNTQISLYQSEIKKYKKFINKLDIPNLYKMYREL